MYDILVFAHLFKPHLGGLEKYVENFYQNLPNKKVLIVTSKYIKNIPDTEKIGNLDVFRIDCIEIIKEKYFVPSFKGLKQIINIFKENYSHKPEVHTHTRFYFTYCIAVYLAKKYKLTHYHFEHGSSFVKDGSILIRAFAYIYDHTLSKYVLRNAKHVFPISESVKQFMNTIYSNIKYGPTLYNSYSFKNEEFRKKSKPETVKILFVGRIIRSKGIFELIEGCKRLKESDFKFTLTMIGNGSEMEELKTVIKENNLEENIILKGSLPYEETQLEYPKHDIFINPSYTEGLPTTVLEAIGNNLLVIATDVGGTREILPMEKLIPLEKLSDTEIEKRVLNMYENWEGERKEYQSIFKGVRDVFSWEKNTKKFINFIEKK